jgi:hypothetical protein
MDQYDYSAFLQKQPLSSQDGGGNYVNNYLNRKLGRVGKAYNKTKSRKSTSKKPISKTKPHKSATKKPLSKTKPHKSATKKPISKTKPGNVSVKMCKIDKTKKHGVSPRLSASSYYKTFKKKGIGDRCIIRPKTNEVKCLLKRSNGVIYWAKKSKNGSGQEKCKDWSVNCKITDPVC